MDRIRQIVQRARRWNKLPSELLSLHGWQAYLFDEACDYVERRDSLDEQDEGRKPKLRIQV